MVCRYSVQQLEHHASSFVFNDGMLAFPSLGTAPRVLSLVRINRILRTYRLVGISHYTYMYTLYNLFSIHNLVNTLSQSYQ